MPKRNLILILALLAAAAVVVTMNRDRPAPGPAGGDAELARLGEVARGYEVISDNYVRPLKDEELSCDAIKGMVEGLDRFSTYIPPGKLSAFRHRMSGRYQGLGLKVEPIDGNIVVIGPIMNSAAHRARIRTGDRLLEIDNEKLGDLTIAQVEELLESGTGKEVELVIQRDGRSRTVTLTREDLPVETVVGLCRDRSGNWVYSLDKNGMAYIRIKEFVPTTVDDLEQVLKKLGRPRGIVLDLRDNPGGMLPPAVGVANLFIRKGIIVTSIDRSGVPRSYRATADKTYSDTIPLVVLVNGNTASAAEIVSGSLMVHSRAVLVGTRTLGKGCVQTMFDLGEKLGQINLTTAEYYLDGRLSITKGPDSRTWGVEPHVQVVLMKESELEGLRVRAEVLFQPTPETMPASWPSDDDGMVPTFLEFDTQLAKAAACLRQPEEMQTLIRQGADALAKARAALTRPSGSHDSNE